MHVVITGGLGFIGSNITARLVDQGHQVTILDNMTTSLVTEMPGAAVFNVDLLDDSAVAAIELPPADCLMLLARSSSGPDSMANPVEAVTGEYRATYNTLVLAARLGAKKVLHASTMTVYGNVRPEDNPVREDAPCLPESHYAIGKFANERLVEIFCKDHSMGFNNLRMFNVYGFANHARQIDHGLVDIFVDMVMRGDKVVSQGSLERFRDLVHVDDVVTAWVLCATQNHTDGALNVGSGEAITIKDMIGAIADELGVAHQLEIEVADGTPGDIFGIVADISALRAATGFTPAYSPYQGLRKLTRWARENGQTAAPVGP